MDKDLQAMSDGRWRRGRGLWTVLTALTLAACFGGEGQTPATLQTPLFVTMTPTAAAIGEPTSFTVTGLYLPLTALLSMAGGTCATPVNRTASGFSAACTPGGVAGNQIVTVNTDTLANNGWWLGQQTVAVAAGASNPQTPTTPLPPLTTINLLTDSGINSGQCYVAGSDVLVSCVSPTAIALNDKQDGMTGRDVTSADNSDGQAGLSYSTWGTFAKTDCVRDNVTGLLWQGKSTVLVAFPGDARNLEANGLVTTTNTAALCGFSDWRLPSRGELQSLVNYGSLDLYFAIDLNWFPDTRIGAYYSVTKYAPNLKNVWVVDFIKGGVVPDSNASSGIYVRLVR